MTDAIREGRDEIVCRCSGTTTEQVIKLLEKGVADLDGISRATGACSGCGACDSDIQALIDQFSQSRTPGNSELAA